MLKPELFHGKKVLITGHTGFKGAWLSLWLRHWGADVIGYSLPPPTGPSLFSLTALEEQIIHLTADVRDFDTLQRTVEEFRPEIVFHLAAQSLVLPSFQEPKETFDTNVGGTTNLLEALRNADCVQAAVIVTTDKCYENKEWDWGYREIDQLGGTDPYSASKAMTELLTASYRSSLYKNGPLIASARAGNVIGGGDFSKHRLIPDLMRGILDSKPVQIRSPMSVRPWLYVLDALSGYLLLVQRLMEEGSRFAEAWNFAPLELEGISVAKAADEFLAQWGKGEWIDASDPLDQREMQQLRLSREKAACRLKWEPAYSWKTAVRETVEWYQCFSSSTSKQIQEKCTQQIDRYALFINAPARCFSH